MRIVVEGWRFLPHSYAVVSRALCLTFLDRGVEVFHREAKPFRPDWQPVRGLIAAADEARIAAIPEAPADLDADIVFRCAFPYDLAPARAGRTFVHMTAELGMVPDQCMAGEPLARAHARGDAVIVTPSEFSRAGIVAGGADPARVAVVPHGIDPRVFAPAAVAERDAMRRQLGWYGRVVFMNVGTMTENKGLDVLLAAFAVVAARDPRALLVLKGLDGLYGSSRNIAAFLRKLGIADPEICRRIAYSGEVMSAAELAGLYRAADAYVSPYLAEGFNIPVLEAAACGLPVICTAGGATDEFTTSEFAHRIHSRSGPSRWGVGTSLEPDLAHTIVLMQRIADDEDLRQHARAEGPRHVRAHLTWDHVAERLLALFSGRTSNTAALRAPRLPRSACRAATAP